MLGVRVEKAFFDLNWSLQPQWLNLKKLNIIKEWLR